MADRLAKHGYTFERMHNRNYAGIVLHSYRTLKNKQGRLFNGSTARKSITMYTDR